MRRSAVYSKSVDPYELATHFSNEQAIQYKDMKSSNISFDDIHPFLELLPKREVDLLEQYFKLKKNQKDIARIFGVTQGAISSRISRAIKRLEFLRDLPKLNDNELEEKLCELFDPVEIEIIKTMIMTTCQSKTADIINSKFGFDEKTKMTQVKVRHRFEKCLNRLKLLSEDKPELEKYYKLLCLIKNNLYMLHEVKLPHFDRGNFAVFSLNS